MEYLTYEEYTTLGGTVSETLFTKLERKSERKLDYFTQNRLKALTVIPSEVKECMIEFVDRIQNEPLNGNISSYSNSIESISYSENQASALNDELYQIAVEYLPIEYITAYVPTIEEIEAESDI